MIYITTQTQNKKTIKYLISYNENQKKSILSKENNVIVNDFYEPKKYIKESLIDNIKHKNVHLGIIPNKTITNIKKI